MPLNEEINGVENTTLDTLYIVDNSDRDITIEIRVGMEEQTGLLTVRLNDETIVQNHSGNFPETVLGTNSSLSGKQLTVVATIADTSRTTNFTSLTICLSGGPLNHDFPLFKTVDNEGESADYLCLIEFFRP